jgi:hypothetical protein
MVKNEINFIYSGINQSLKFFNGIFAKFRVLKWQGTKFPYLLMYANSRHHIYHHIKPSLFSFTGPVYHNPNAIVPLWYFQVWLKESVMFTLLDMGPSPAQSGNKPWASCNFYSDKIRLCSVRRTEKTNMGHVAVLSFSSVAPLFHRRSTPSSSMKYRRFCSSSVSESHSALSSLFSSFLSYSSFWLFCVLGIQLR